MDRREALELLSSESAFDRLRAARILRHLAVSSSDRALIEAAHRTESDAWVRSALSRITSHDPKAPSGKSPEEQVVEDGTLLAHDIRAQTTQELTAMVAHELDPLLGTLRMCCMKEISSFEESETKRSIAGLESFLKALRGLYKASGVPSVSDFSLNDVVFDSIETVLEERRQNAAEEIKVEAARKDYVGTLGDPDLVRLALVNILRNALEASDSTSGGQGLPVVVNWGFTERDAWVSVLDEGVGLPPGASGMVKPGVTNKDKGAHSGMGLPVCIRALKGLNGALALRPREGGGVVAEMRWKGDEGKNAGASN